jgi:putative addiction module killer protein
MFSVKALPEFDAWLAAVPEPVRGVIGARIRRLGWGLTGDAQPVGAGVSELRIHMGQGWRVYYTQRGSTLVVLLAGGSKRTQRRDINRALELAALLEPREKPQVKTRKGKS